MSFVETEKSNLNKPLKAEGHEGDFEEGENKHGGGLMQKIMPTGGMLASCFSFSAASMGAGTLGLPSAMQAAGAAWGAILLILVCASTVYSIRLLVIVVEKTNYMTYESMAQGLMGHWFERLTAFLIVAFCWGCTIAYVVAIGGVMHKLSGASWFPEALSGHAGGQILTIIYWACFMMPLSLAQEINSLRYASTLGVCSTIFLVCSIVAHSATEGQENPKMAEDNLTYFTFNMDMLVALPIFIFSYCCQTNAFEIYTEMNPRTVRQMTKNATLSMVICTSIYITAGIAGYANFGAATDGNILNNLDPLKSVYIAMAFFAVTITLTAAFPLCIFPTRDAVLQAMKFESAYDTPSYIRILVCFTLCFGSLVCGLYVPGIKVLFGVLGGICGSSLAFIWPAIFYIKGVDGGFSVANVGYGNFICVWLLIIVGVIAGVLGTAVSIYQTATG